MIDQRLIAEIGPKDLATGIIIPAAYHNSRDNRNRKYIEAVFYM
jgi:hypothetical protein